MANGDTAVRFLPLSHDCSSVQQAADGCAWTFILPAVTVGNVGQLAVDLLLSSTDARHIGRLAAPATLPFAASAPAVPAHLSAIVTTIELYAVRTTRGAVIVAQQRAPVARGRAAEHALELIAWARMSGCGKIVVLGSANAAGRRDLQICAGDSPSARMRFAATQALMECLMGERLLGFGWSRVDGRDDGLGWSPGESGLSSAEEERLDGTGKLPAFLPTTRKGSFIREVLQACNDSAYPLVALLMFVHEGDNSGDAQVMASAASVLLDIVVEAGTDEGSNVSKTSYGVGEERRGNELIAGMPQADPLSAYMQRWKVPSIWHEVMDPPRGLY
jgi:proteasome assembly chaperone 2